jgi:hypothetical protein
VVQPNHTQVIHLETNIGRRFQKGSNNEKLGQLIKFGISLVKHHLTWAKEIILEVLLIFLQ